jgi:hypothetical protein
MSKIRFSRFWPRRFPSASRAFSIDLPTNSRRCFPPGSLKEIQYLTFFDRFDLSMSLPQLQCLFVVACFLWHTGHSANTLIKPLTFSLVYPWAGTREVLFAGTWLAHGLLFPKIVNASIIFFVGFNPF